MPWKWDPDKNEQNKTKHRISFETAQTVFKDEDAITFDDPYRHETRFRTIGAVGRLLLIVVHTEDDPEPTTGERNGRIISARKTVTDERDLYEEKRRWAY